MHFVLLLKPQINLSFVAEPRGGAQDDFDSVLKGYYDSIRGKNRLIGRNRRLKKAGLVKTEFQDDSKKGAAFFAVCRGKVCHFFFLVSVIGVQLKGAIRS